jgi:tetratricopeptide (TPR) repeat protein
MTKSVAVWAASLAMAGGPVSAQQKPKPPSISKGIVKQVQAAQAAIKGSKWGECVSQLKQADGVAGKTPYDDHAINELLGFCAIRTNDYSTAAKALEVGLNSGFLEQDQVPSRVRALAQVNYQIKNYAKAIEFGNRAVKGGFADADMYTLIAQAYYIQNDYKGTLKFVSDWVADQQKRGQTPREGALQLMLSSCLKLEDDACTTRALEKLVAAYPKDEYWQNLMRSMFRSGGNDKTMINVYRLATEVNAMRRPEDYTEMAQLSIESGVPGEAQSVLESAFAKKVFADQRDIDRNNRLLATAKAQAATDKASLAKQEKDASAAKTGEADLRIGQAYMSYGQIPQAVAAIQRGIAKGGLKNPSEAQLLLGMAQLKAGNKSEAIKAFKAVSGDEVMTRLGNLWALHAQQ